MQETNDTLQSRTGTGPVNLPVPAESLTKALIEASRFGEDVLTRIRICNVLLPSGKLVACDPGVASTAEPFDLPLPKGEFPVVMSIVRSGDHQRLAFATIRMGEKRPVTWTLLTSAGQAASSVESAQPAGYRAETGTGCFMDARAATLWADLAKDKPEARKEIVADLERRHMRGWDWKEYRLGDKEQNLVTFTAGSGGNICTSYAGFDAENQVSAIVTDLGVLQIN